MKRLVILGSVVLVVVLLVVGSIGFIVGTQEGAHASDVRSGRDAR